MDRLILNVITPFVLVLNAFYPRVLGDTTAFPYFPFRFTSSGHECLDQTTCIDWCLYTYNYGGTGDAMECEKYVPRPSLFPSPTPYPSPSTTSFNSLSPYETTSCGLFTAPHKFNGSSLICSTCDQCYQHCYNTIQFGGTGDGQECRLLYPNLNPLPAYPSFTPTPTRPPTTYYFTPSPTPFPTERLLSYREIYPKNINLSPGQSIQFSSYLVSSSGQKTLESNSALTWKVVGGGGWISSTGLFTAANTPGTFPNTIKAEVYGSTLVAYASVTITASTLTLPPPTPTFPPSSLQSPLIPTPTPYSSLPINLLNSVPQGAAVTLTPLPSPLETPLAPPNPSPAAIFMELNTRVNDCLKTKFSSVEYQAYFALDGLHQDLNLLGARLDQVKACLLLKRIPDLNPDTEICLKQQLGQERFLLIYSNQSEPTASEQNLTNLCYNQPNIINYSQVSTTDEATLSCLKINLGTDRYRAIYEQNSPPTTAEVSLGRECLNLDTNILKPPLVASTPTTANTCLNQIIAPERLAAIQSGKTNPTQNEQQAVQSCFDTPNRLAAFLPAPASQIVFLPIEQQTTHIKDAQSKTTPTRNVLTFSGKAIPNSLVEIYIFSTPLIVTAKTDANGNWSYDLSYHLESGNHQAYSIVRHPEKGLVRSEVFAFDVAYAQDNINQNPRLVVSPQDRKDLQRYLAAAAALVLLASGFIVLLFKIRLTNQAIAKLTPTPPVMPQSPPPATSP